MAELNVNHYIVRRVLGPSAGGLTQGAVALTIRNISSLALGFVELGGQTLFIGTNAATGSLWGFQRVTGVPANGTVLTPFKCHPNGADPATQVEVRHSDTGAITGVTANGVDIHHLGIASQVGAATPIPLVNEVINPVALLAPNDVLIVYAQTAIVAGSRATVGIRWFMVP